MPKDKKQSHQRVLEAAKQEFFEKGFEAASIRAIGQRAGMTSAGLYRHCRDKEDLFSQVVEPALSEMDEWLQKHAQKQLGAFQTGREAAAAAKIQVGNNDADMIREVIYPNREIFYLILCKSKGTKYENFIHDFTLREQQEFTNALQVLNDMGYPTSEIFDDELHCLLSAYYTALFEPIIHGYGEERMEHLLQLNEQFFMPGWKKILGL